MQGQHWVLGQDEQQILWACEMQCQLAQGTRYSDFDDDHMQLTVAVIKDEVVVGIICTFHQTSY